MSARSLLDYLGAPVLVGDPEGRVVHLNPAFEQRFEVSLSEVRGGLVAALFEGGARESMLRAVAEICSGSGTVRFQVREEGCGYCAVASPISSEDNRVGVVVLFMDELAPDRRVMECAKGLQTSIDEVARCLSGFAEQVGGRGEASDRIVLEDATNAFEMLRKRAEELQSLLSGASAER